MQWRKKHWTTYFHWVFKKKRSTEKEVDIDFWTTLSCEQQKDIELGIAEINDGNTISYESVMKKHRL